MRELTETIEIEAPLQDVWNLLADFGNAADWAPSMRESRLAGHLESGVGTRRTMRHSWGFRFEESVTEWSHGTGYSFDVLRAPYPMKDVRESWVLEGDNDRSRVTTRVAYDMGLGWSGSLLDWLLVRFIVRREMRAGLRGLKSCLENEAGRGVAAQDAD